MKNLKQGTLLRSTKESYPNDAAGKMVYLGKKTKNDIFVLLSVELSDDVDNVKSDDFNNEYVWTIMHPRFGLLFWTDDQSSFAECFDVITPGGDSNEV